MADTRISTRLSPPENTNIDEIFSIATLGNAVGFNRFISLDICLAVFKAEQSANIIGMPFIDIRMHLECSIVAVYRGNDTITDLQSAEVHTSDRILVIGKYGFLVTFNSTVSVKKQARSFVILGAAEMRISISDKIVKIPGKKFLKIIDRDVSRYKQAARMPTGVIVVNGSISDPVFLRSENVNKADVLISITEHEEKNFSFA